MKRAKFIADVSGKNNVSKYANAHLYKLVPAMNLPDSRFTHFVVICANDHTPFGSVTYTYEADRQGRVLDWTPREGSIEGAKDHERALRNLGYTVEQ